MLLSDTLWRHQATNNCLNLLRSKIFATFWTITYHGCHRMPVSRDWGILKIPDAFPGKQIPWRISPYIFRHLPYLSCIIVVAVEINNRIWLNQNILCKRNVKNRVWCWFLSFIVLSKGLLPDTQHFGLHMRRECQECLPCHRAVMHVGVAN